MKSVLLCLVLAVITFGQTLTPAEQRIDNDPLAKKDYIKVAKRPAWTFVTETSASGGIRLYSHKDWRRLDNGDAEVWIKAVPDKPRQFFKKFRNAAYIVSLYTLHCQDDRVTTENPVIYNARGHVILSIPNFMLDALGALYREPIVPGSVNAGIENAFCGEHKIP